MRIPFAVQNYQLASTPANSETLLNFYAEAMPDGSRSGVILRNTPGLVSARTCGTGPIIAMDGTLPAILYVISGTGFYRMRTDVVAPPVFLGTIGTSVSTVQVNPTIAVGNHSVVVCVPPNAYIVNHAAYSVAINTSASTASGSVLPFASDGPVEVNMTVTGLNIPGGTLVASFTPTSVTLTNAITGAIPSGTPITFASDNTVLHQITGSSTQTFPGASSVAYIDGYFVFTDTNGATFFCSNLLDGLTYDGLNYATANPRPDVTPRVVYHLGDIWLFGFNAVEVWYDAGYTNFPFDRRAGGDIPHGCVNPISVAECDGSLFWLGTDNIVYRNIGYTAVRVSDFALEEWLRTFANINQMDACAYTQNGHWFYIMTFYGIGTPTTWAYETKLKAWAKRASDPGGVNVWQGLSAVNAQGFALIGSRTTNDIFALGPTTSTDNGVPVKHVAVLPPLWADTKRAFMSRLELEMEVGYATTNPAVILEISDDGGKTWRSMDAGSSGAVGNFTMRVFWTRLGSFRQRMMRFTTYDYCALYGVDVDVTQGNA